MPANRIQLQNALHKPYDRVLFSREVLSPVFGSGFTLYSSLVPASVSPNKSESAAIANVWIYGKIQLDDSTEITCYEVLLQPKVRIEQSKVAIQQYVRKLLTAGQAALINFVAPANKNVWRLTLVAKDSVLTDKGVKEKTTNAKRYTFLLGPSESCKTAAERFEVLSTEKEITFQTLVNAFSVEKLSKAFFDEYTLHYQNFCNYLQESNYRKSVFNITFPDNATKEEKEKACKPIRDFVKKLMGRIVFLYFVQKKGWLGASNTNYTDGMHDFIKQLFHQSGGNDAFYSNWLTILFFDTLNRERPNDDFTMPDGKTVKVPFLNGGLFDKEEFDEHLLTFPAKLFHNPDFEDTILTPKNNGFARGFLDFLDAFNFTVYEDSPDDHTVAVDPEMLGHIFENLLEDNKDKGAFYTPKEIVHYMCQESLTEYLCTSLKIVDEVAEREAVNHLLKNKVVADVLKPEIAELEKALDNVKICDPAIGSGAFPMGLLLEIFSIKELIAYETGKPWNPAQTKLNIIQNSIYGVDIEKGAVDIARLRFWLSLVVDEEKPKALPNLDYKIVVGDSLISKFDGEIVEIDWEIKGEIQTDMFGNENLQKRKQLLQNLTEKQRTYFDPQNKNKKALALEIRNGKIDVLINQLELMVKIEGLEQMPIKTNFKGNKKYLAAQELYLKTQGWIKTINKLKDLKQHPEKPFNHFDWKLDFPEVLNPYLVPDENQRGFDIVIANPPYISIRTKSFNNNLKEFFKSKYKLARGQYDLYILFIEKTNEILKKRGIMSFIIPKRMLSNENFQQARVFILDNFSIFKYVDAEMPFETANVEGNIMLCKKGLTANLVQSVKFDSSSKEFVHITYVSLSAIDMMPFNIFPFIYDESKLKVLFKIQNQNIHTLSQFVEITRGFECGYNDEAIDNKKSNFKLIKADSIGSYVLKDNNYVFCNPDFSNPSKYKTRELFEKTPKLLTKFVASKIEFALDEVGYFNTNSVYNVHLKRNVKISIEYLLGILNSKLVTFWFNTAFFNTDTLFPHIQKNQLEAIPLKYNESIAKTIKPLVLKIITQKSQGKDTTALEQQIDNLVYRLYDLTYEEVKVIDHDFPLSRQEYEAIRLE
ncbi:MAG: hypothetical protein PWR03_2272 [Tenuifilum sp.]|uniref:Eco57I restriction-modification methylase domain-containing protein n=1 Tax=Tenuifilum sp. TaxID=2760880 RepID=UPI0024AAAB40|nr:TaqI-like C-terminal specificity domain-containing protein [Tenuifilum sp.]MDI3528088.1 hypothetical protein [Tenuifilum sp.]